MGYWVLAIMSSTGGRSLIAYRCVLGEMFMRRPILPGTTDVDQLEKIWALCGTPNQHTWPNYDDLPGCDGVKRFDTTYSRRLRQAYDSFVHLSFSSMLHH
jgi:hypothetical protein